MCVHTYMRTYECLDLLPSIACTSTTNDHHKLLRDCEDFQQKNFPSQPFPLSKNEAQCRTSKERWLVLSSVLPEAYHSIRIYVGVKG